MDYHFKEIEKKWQEYWANNKTFAAQDNSTKPKYYVLDMFPYPSGAGLHVGHPLGYIASDIMARYKRHKGFNVLHPMGYDSFGLPAEQYAIQTGQHPAITTKINIDGCLDNNGKVLPEYIDEKGNIKKVALNNDNQIIKGYRKQLDQLGLSFDWEREVRTSDPSYYKWTQWIFLELFNSWYNKSADKTEKIDSLISEFEKNGNTNVNAVCDDNTPSFTSNNWKNFNEKEKSDMLMHYRIAYLGEAYVNWCPALGTVLANDEVKDGVSERGGHPVERKLMKQWSMRITAYAQRLLDGLDTIDWTDSLKEAQRYWIGRSEGTSLKFRVMDLSPTLSEGKGADASMEEPGYYKTNSKLWSLLKDKVLEMRSNPTPAEDKLWKAVRTNKLGVRFRRQHVIDRFIVDFVCLSKNLVVEVDGDIHDFQKEEDEARTEHLNNLGYKVIRFKNDVVLSQIENVINEIKENLNEQSKVLPFGEDLGGVNQDNSNGGEAYIEVFTTRPDTIFGVSFVTLAPEHDLVEKITTEEQKQAVDDYVTKAKNRSERERQADVTKVSGVFTGAYVEHPFSGKPIPVWVGDYVLAGYGTGAVMAVPGHDERDFRFAKHFDLAIPQVIEPNREHDFEKDAWGEKEGKLINSDFLNGLEVKDAIKKAIEEIEKAGLGKGKINYRLRDAVFGRQRYWGEPIPIYYKDGIPHAIEQKHLPLELPKIDKYLPTEDGEPPLARADKWYYNPIEGVTTPPLRGGDGGGVLETTTMPGWAGSSWYFMRYMDPNNDNAFADKKLLDYWQNVDLYIGGSEHATGHLLYVRFWTKALKDLGYISIEEPAQKLINQGMIQGTSMLVNVVGYIDASMNIGETMTLILPNDAIPIPTRTPIRKLNFPVNFIKFENGEYFLDRESLEQSKEIFSHLKSYKLLEDELDDENFTFNYKEETKLKFHLTPIVEKMSKSKWNVVSPDDICEKFGADTLRLYEMFLGPLELSKPWNTNGITGVHNFLKKLWKLAQNVIEADKALSPSERAGSEASKPELKTLHKTIKKITEDIERFSFNTSVSNFMICVNELTEQKCNKREILEPLLVIISPYAPHIAEELWSQLGHKESICFEKFPEFNESYLVEDNFNYPISFNGKTRFNLELSATLSPAEIEKTVLEFEQTQKYLEGKTPKKVIVVPKKIVNIVI
ncbi:MAG: leucine--tRNA ligase [Bacteroidia bacterium]